MEYKQLTNEPVFKFFQEINNIPRESGNEKAISDYLIQFGKDRGLYTRQDDANNVVIKKPGTHGLEDKDAVIIQGHMDMVCVKNNDSDHNFITDPIKMVIEDDYITADGTTLGADNGIAIAMGLALIDSEDIPHPPIELVVTTDEEVGLTGAIKMDTSDLDGKYFLNLDSEEEGEFTVSCAGGIRVTLKQKIGYQAMMSHGLVMQEIEIAGLKGGHSGVEIDTNRANALKLLGRVLGTLNKELTFHLLEANGGIKDNVIPSYGVATVVINKKDSECFNNIIDKVEKEIQNEYHSSDGNIAVNTTEMVIDTEEISVLDSQTQSDAIFLLQALPNGIQTMSNDIKDLVESSLNIGVLKTEEDTISYVFALRSSHKSYKYYMVDVLESFAKQYNMEVIKYGDYPSWPLKAESNLEKLCVELYEKETGKVPEVKGIHAGLECGVFLEKMPHLEAISIGPDMAEVHSPNERLSISSTRRIYTFVQKLLKAL